MIFSNSKQRIRNLTLLALVFALCGLPAGAQQISATLRGQLKDELGGVLVGVKVVVVDANGVEKTSNATDADGSYMLTGLTPGRYTVRVKTTGFAPYENLEVELTSGQRQTLDITLRVALKDEEVTVSSGTNGLSTDPENNTNAVVLRGTDLDALADDPDQLAADLRAIAGPGDGPNGSQFFVDGFSGGRVPPKSSIREVRLNANPFAAEQEFFGFGRIDIITKPGADKMRGSAFMNFNDESLNARNPFALNRAPFQARLYGGNLSGPIVAKKASYFIDFERRDITENAFINASILDPALNFTQFKQVILTPQRRTNFSARVDYQLNKNNTLVGRYNHLRTRLDNAGVGGFSLPSLAFDTSRIEDTLQLTETAVLSTTMLTETRFQFIHSRRKQEGDNTLPTIIVQDAFIGGGQQLGFASNDIKRYELQNNTIWSHGAHTVKIGGRLRASDITDIAPTNFGGTFIFSSLQQYREVLSGVAGARPAQFSIAGGDEDAKVRQIDLSAYVQDDWRVRPDFTLSYGLRVESQTNLADGIKFAPRVAFAWAPGASAATKRPQTVIRAGFGMYYSRFEETLTLDSDRFNGINQQQFIIPNPSFFPNVPTTAQLGQAQTQTIRRISDDLSTPYAYYAAFSVERQLPRNTTISATYIYELYRQQLRSRNINAPLPGTYNPNNPASAVRPYPGLGNIFAFESGGVGTDNTLFINLRSQVHKRVNIFALFALSRETDDTEGAYEFPANSYDLAGEYAQASFDAHAFGNLGATINGPWGLTLSPFIRASSPTFFNIFTGIDSNGDAIFNDRPAFATDLNRPSVVVTRYGAFDLDPLPGQQIIPRNYGKNSSFFQVNMRVSKTFKFNSLFGGSEKVALKPGAAAPEKRYGLTLAVIAQNIFNHTNPAPNIGNLSSPNFGRPIATLSTPRRIDLSVRFSF
jgi:hypothetical protein